VNKPIATSHFHLTLKAERERRKWTLRQTGELMNMSAQQLYALETGENDMQLNTLRRWAAIFDWQVALIEKEH
jgi:transcriptional regulator with XRE-family HTH domain